jgi:hypothetical protein
MLGTLKDTITGSSDTKKAQRLAQLAVGNRNALYEAGRKLSTDHGENSRTEKASSLLRDAVLILAAH